jgi:carbamoyl-phosphate synthase large subunit
MLISLNDLELLLISQNQGRFRAIGVLPVISSPEVIRICLDKWETFSFLAAHEIATARTYLTLDEAKDALAQGEVAFPLMVKPRWGSASLGVERVADTEELELVYALATMRQARVRGTEPRDADLPTVVIQERLGGQEHGVDVVNDLEGRYVATFARRKLLMRSGETDRAIAVQRPELELLGQALSAALTHVGNLDCDVFVEGPRCSVIDMNPRFGGGYPFAHAAGANLPAALLAWAEGLAPDPEWLSVTRDVVASKNDHLLIVRSGRGDWSDRRRRVEQSRGARPIVEERRSRTTSRVIHGMREVPHGEWDELLTARGLTDSYLRNGYVRASTELDGGEAKLLVLELPEGGVAFPFVVRTIPDDPTLFDVTSPYGYGGPVGFGAGELRSGLARGTGWTIDRNWAGQAGISGFEGQRISEPHPGFKHQFHQ